MEDVSINWSARVVAFGPRLVATAMETALTTASRAVPLVILRLMSNWMVLVYRRDPAPTVLRSLKDVPARANKFADPVLLPKSS